jgi:ABC-type transporter Mla subunit MlaD
MNNNLKVGAFVLSGLAIIVAGLLVLGANVFLSATIPAETYIDETVQGLDIGSLVKQRGVTIGKVSRIDFVRNAYALSPSDPNFERDNRLVLVQMELQPKALNGIDGNHLSTVLQPLIANGLRIRMAAQGLTGTAYLEIDYVANAGPPMAISWTPRSYYIPSVPSTLLQLTKAGEAILGNLQHADIAALINGATSLVTDLRDATASLRVLLNPADVGEMRNDLKATLKGAHEMVANTSGTLAATLADLRRSSAELAELTQTLNQSLRSGDLGQTLANANKLTANLQAVTARLPETLNLVDDTIRHLNTITLSGQDDLTTMLANLDAASQNLRELTESAKLYPSQILFGQPPAPRPGDHP